MGLRDLSDTEDEARLLKQLLGSQEVGNQLESRSLRQALAQILEGTEPKRLGDEEEVIQLGRVLLSQALHFSLGSDARLRIVRIVAKLIASHVGPYDEERGADLARRVPQFGKVHKYLAQQFSSAELESWLGRSVRGSQDIQGQLASDVEWFIRDSRE